jgi:hypothetical protein
MGLDQRPLSDESHNSISVKKCQPSFEESAQPAERGELSRFKLIAAVSIAFFIVLAIALGVTVACLAHGRTVSQKPYSSLPQKLMMPKTLPLLEDTDASSTITTRVCPIAATPLATPIYLPSLPGSESGRYVQSQLQPKFAITIIPSTQTKHTVILRSGDGVLAGYTWLL